MSSKPLNKQLISEVRKFLTSLIIIASSALLGLILLLLVNTLPADTISANVSEKISTQSNAWDSDDAWTRLDTYTDNLMLNIAAFPKQESLVRRTLLVPYADFYGGADMSSHLTDLVNGREVTPEYTTYYGRYWHGYLTVLKPVLTFLNYGQIRILNLVVMLFLLFLVEKKTIKASGLSTGLAFLSVLLCINPVSAVLCMQYSTLTYITLISVLILLAIREKSEKIPDLFFLYLTTGIAVAFFDLLTFPLVTLGTLLITELLTEKNTESLFSKLYSIVRKSAYWCLGYFGMWGSKHLLVGMLTDYDIWLDVKATAFTRIKGGELDLSLANIYKENLRIIAESPVLIILLILIVICALASLIMNKKLNATEKFGKSIIAELIPCVFIALYPFVWYAVLRNHSLTHCWLTFRELAIMVYAITGMVVVCIKRNKKETR